jgi:YHS domain-containing protein
MKSWMFPDTRPKNSVSGKLAGQIDDVMIKDPYCETYFPRRDAVHLNLSGNDLYFCSKECRDQYMARQSKEN